MRDEAAPWIRRLGRPLPAAMVFCALGLLSAVLAVAVNRIASSRPPSAPVIAVAPGTSPTAGAGASSASASPPPIPQVRCAGSPRPQGGLRGLVSAAPVEVAVSDGTTSLAVVIPAGAALDGTSSDVHAHLDGAPADQHLHGTLVQDADICARRADASLLRVTVHAGAALDGDGGSGATGVQAADIHIRAQGNGSGDEGD